MFFLIKIIKRNLKLYPEGDDLIKNKKDNNNEIASVYLENVDGTDENYCHFYAHYILFIRNYNDYSCYIRKSNYNIKYYNKLIIY